MPDVVAPRICFDLTVERGLQLGVALSIRSAGTSADSASVVSGK